MASPKVKKKKKKAHIQNIRNLIYDKQIHALVLFMFSFVIRFILNKCKTPSCPGSHN